MGNKIDKAEAWDVLVRNVKCRAMIEFGVWCADHWPEGDVDGGEIQEALLRFGIIAPVAGGFNPDIHRDDVGCASPGDEWFMPTDEYRRARNIAKRPAPVPSSTAEGRGE